MSLATHKQLSYIYGLSVVHRDFQEFVGYKTWDADWPEILLWLNTKFDLNILTENKITQEQASTLIDNIKSL